MGTECQDAVSREIWSGRRESNPHIQLGKLTFYH